MTKNEYIEKIKRDYDIDIETFMKLFYNGMSQVDIANYFNVTRKVIRTIGYKLGLDWGDRKNKNNNISSFPSNTYSSPIITFSNNNIKKKKNSKVIKRIGFIADTHLGYHDEHAILLAIDYLKDRDLDILILGGDIMDFESISFWKSLNKYTLKEELDMAKDFLSWIRFNFPQPKMYYLEGNHSQRIQRHLLTNAKEFAYLDELRISNLLKLDSFNITYISNAELLQKNGKPFKIGRIVFLHGSEVRMSWGAVNLARTMYLKTQDNVIFGHFHTTQEYIFRNISNEVRGAWSVGALCNLNPNYSPVNNWNQGFAYIEIYSDGDFVVHNKKIINGKIL